MHDTFEQLVDRFVRSMGTPDFRPAEIALLAKFKALQTENAGLRVALREVHEYGLPELAALREATHWIPVSERLPEEWQDVEVVMKGKGISTTTYQVGWKWCYDTPTFWRPMPQLPEEVEK